MEILSAIRKIFTPSRCLTPSEWLSALPLVTAEVERWWGNLNEFGLVGQHGDNSKHYQDWREIQSLILNEESVLEEEVKIFGPKAEDQLRYPIKIPHYLYGRLMQLLSSSPSYMKDSSDMLEEE
jgi:hypothetical protein